MNKTENNSIEHDQRLDAKGLKCPMPLLKMKQALSNLPTGAVLLVETTDPHSVKDFNSYIDLTTHRMACRIEQGIYQYWITKQAPEND